MSDEDWYRSHRPLTPARQSKAGELLFEFVCGSDHSPLSCELRFHGESYGWECQCLYDGELAYGRRFLLREHALDEAEAQRQRLQKAGWTAPVTGHPADAVTE